MEGSVRVDAAALRFANVGTFWLDPAFFTCIGLGRRLRPTMGLPLFSSPFDTCGTGGVCGTLSELEAVTVEPDFTLTTAGLALLACWAGSDDRNAFVATLARNKLGLMLLRLASESCE